MLQAVPEDVAVRRTPREPDHRSHARPSPRSNARRHLNTWFAFTPCDPRVQLGKTVRQKRLSLGLSQEALGEKADLHWTYIGGIERGERNVSLVNIVRIARALGIAPAKLFVGIQ